MIHTAPRVFVVLLNYNGWRNTIECLESVLRSDYPELRVIVVDNCSTDESRHEIREWCLGRTAAPLPGGALSPLCTPPIPKPVPLAEWPRAHLDDGPVEWIRGVNVVLAEKNLGFSAGNNVMLRYVQRHEPEAMTLLLNNDTVIAPTAIAAMVERATVDEDGLTAVGATILQYHRPDRVETLGGGSVSTWHGCSEMIGWDTTRDAPRPDVTMHYVSGCCVLIPPAALSRVGLLDERFFIYNEDADWGIRARAAGIRLSYASSAEVWHKGSATMVVKTAFYDYHSVKSLLHFARKHRPRLFPLALVYLCTRLGLAKLARGEWTRLRTVVSAFGDFRGERAAFPVQP